MGAGRVDAREEARRSAALAAVGEMAAGLAASGESLLDELARLRKRYGFYVNRQTSFTLTGAKGAAKIREAMRLRLEDERGHIASERVERHVREDVLIYDLEDGGRVAVRPSGTEPKAKIYALASGDSGGSEPGLDAEIERVDATLTAVLADARARAEAIMAPIVAEAG